MIRHLKISHKTVPLNCLETLNMINITDAKSELNQTCWVEHFQMLFGIASTAVKVLASSFVVWVFLTTILPQCLTKYTNNDIKLNDFKTINYPYESITSFGSIPIKNSTVYFIIGHPDDEVMFFSPSIIELGKPSYNNILKLICFSNGDAVDPSFGPIRSSELVRSSTILGIDPANVVVLDKFKDGMDIHWNDTDVASTLENYVKESDPTIITFDENGVSNHPNHISLYYGCKNFIRTHKKAMMFKLTSLNFVEKYSFTVLTNIEMFVNHISKLLLNNILKFNINITFFNTKEHNSIKIYSDLNMLSVSYAAMAYGHFSQMVWFRYGWLIISRYLTYNNLVQV